MNLRSPDWACASPYMKGLSMQKIFLSVLLCCAMLVHTKSVSAQKPLEGWLVGKIGSYPIAKWGETIQEQEFLTSLEKSSNVEVVRLLRARFANGTSTDLLYIARVQYDPQFRVSERIRLQNLRGKGRTARFQHAVVDFYKTFDQEYVNRIPQNVLHTLENNVPVSWVGKTRQRANQTLQELWREKKELPIGAMLLVTTTLSNRPDYTPVCRELVRFNAGTEFMAQYERARANNWYGHINLQSVPKSRRRPLDASLSQLYSSLSIVTGGEKPSPEKQVEMDFIHPLIMELRK